jgi:hypothetical protein
VRQALQPVTYLAGKTRQSRYHYGMRHNLLRAFCLLVTLALLPRLAFSDTAPPATQPASPAEPSKKVAAALSKHLPELRFDGVALDDQLDFVRDVTGLNIIVDWNALVRVGITPKAPGTVQLKDVEIKEAISAMLAQVSTPTGHSAFAGVADAVVISSPEGLQRIQHDTQAMLDLIASQKGSPLARKLPQIKFDNVAFSDVMDFLSDVSGAKFNVDWDALAKAGIKKDTLTSLMAHDISFGQLLVSILDTNSDAAANFQIGSDKNVITIAATRKPDKK